MTETQVDPMETVRAAAPAGRRSPSTCCPRRPTPPPRCWPGSCGTCSPAAGPAWAASTTCCRRPTTAGRLTQRAVAVGDVAALLVRDGAGGADVREHLPAPRPRAAARGRDVAAAEHRLPLPRVDLRPRRRAASRRRASATTEPSTPAEHGLVELPVEVWQGWVFGHALHPLGSDRGAVVRRAPRRPRPAASRRTTCGDAGARRPAHLRGRGELEGDRRELPRVLPLPADPPASCARSARRTPATTTTCPVPGSAARWSCATGWRRCR